jgi:hypothetical protein
MSGPASASPGSSRAQGLTASTLLLTALLAIQSGTTLGPSGPATAAAGPSSLQAEYRQVTIFGIAATPGGTSIDPKLLQIDSELAKLKPGHGFKLRAVQTKRLSADEALPCDLGDSLTATATLLDPQNAEGKVRIQFQLIRDDKVEFSTVVTTPPNQLFFCERPLEADRVLLIGVGAR